MRAAASPLPDEEYGTAITYTADGTAFLTLSATGKPILRRYTPYQPPPPTADTTGAGDSGPPAAAAPGWLDRFNGPQRTRILAAVGATGLVLAIAGLVRGRRKRRRRERWRDDDYDDDDDYNEGVTTVPARVCSSMCW